MSNRLAPRGVALRERSGRSRRSLASLADADRSPRCLLTRAFVACDDRGVYASFIAVIASALMLLGAIAYDGPRVTIARQDAVHAANEAARVAAATIASGGTLGDARIASEQRMDKSRLIYGQPIAVGDIECVGSRVQVTVVSNYVYRSAMGLIRDRQPIEAVGAAEAYLVLPDDSPSELKYLGECPL